MFSWFLIFLLLFLLVLIPTAYAGLIGAPYVPTRRRALEKAFDAIGVSSADTIVDLGCGDGGVLIEAARRGARVVGYELSPLMFAVAWLRLLRLPRTARRLRWGNFFNQTLPAETTIIFVFLMPKHLPRLVAYLKKQNLSHAKYLLSYTFALPGVTPRQIIQTKTYGTIYVYNFKF